MADLTGRETEHSGSCGTAQFIPIPGDLPEAAESVCCWLITAPRAHPLWSQYWLAAVRLRDGVPGFPPPVRKFPGATHEVLLLALDPDHGPYTVEGMRIYIDGDKAGRLPFLTPVNIAHQLEGTDDEVRTLASYAAWSITVGALNPETADAPTAIRHAWDTSLIKTLAHIRGEVHAQ